MSVHKFTKIPQYSAISTAQDTQIGLTLLSPNSLISRFNLSPNGSGVFSDVRANKRTRPMTSMGSKQNRRNIANTAFMSPLNNSMVSRDIDIKSEPMNVGKVKRPGTSLGHQKNFDLTQTVSMFKAPKKKKGKSLNSSMRCQNTKFIFSEELSVQKATASFKNKLKQNGQQNHRNKSFGLTTKAKNTYNTKLHKQKQLFEEDKKKAGQPIKEESQKQLYSKFFKDFFENPKHKKEFDVKLADKLIEKYSSQFDTMKASSLSKDRSPMYISLDRRKAFINQSDGATGFFSKKNSRDECDGLLQQRLYTKIQQQQKPVHQIIKPTKQKLPSPLIHYQEDSSSDEEKFRTQKFEECFPEAYKIIVKHTPAKQAQSRTAQLGQIMNEGGLNIRGTSTMINLKIQQLRQKLIHR
ncbi:hypothetical protein FGO68_gene12560 [Halteria grandinella]|uniref:Uncharacterized protein n=1 Tax=Halteria grandinella TaxID=5974 RepID=A0A8J8P497_HALGN|nr:hypothetical protein FGO68_gene12560 [Halteria grandinella]